jgi:adenosine deaminase
MWTELHRHLDASFRAETLFEILNHYSIPHSYSSVDDLKKKFWITKPYQSLENVLNAFVLFQKALASPEILERLAYETIEDAARDQIEHIELRYSPLFASEHSKIPQEVVLASFKRGILRAQKKFNTSSKLICILSRDHSEKQLASCIDFAIEHKSDFCAVDLAGPEAAFPTRLFSSLFKKAKQNGLSVTIHAGEGGPVENIWEAIDVCGATRIGHAIEAAKDKKLLSRMQRDGIHIESCPTSNVMTKSVESWKTHPLRTFLDAGISVSINTDDPGIFGNSLQEEIQLSKKHFSLSQSEIEQIRLFGKTSRF